MNLGRLLRMLRLEPIHRNPSLDTTHTCPFPEAAGGLIRPEWCFAHQWRKVRDLPGDLSPSTILSREELLLARDGRITMYYTPFDLILPEAKVLLVGITPGKQQLAKATVAARQAIHDGLGAEGVLRRADGAGSFAGPMRRNLVSMLDDIGLNAALGMETRKAIFGSADGLADSTSLFSYAVFCDGENYRGDPPPERVPLLDAYLTQVFARILDMTPDALVIPLGKAVTDGLRRLEHLGKLDPERCLFGFPHPSGANGWRVKQFQEHRDALEAGVRRWFAAR